MDVRLLDVTQADVALAAMKVSATAFRDGQRYRRLLSEVEQAAGKHLPDPARADPPQCVWGAYADDQLISVATSRSMQMQYEHQVVPMNGVASVATLPEYRRRGAVRAVFSELMRAARDQGDVFSYLFPYSFAYYDPFGYTTGCCRYRVTCPLAQLPVYPESGRVRHGRMEDLDSVQAVYQRFTAGTNGAVVRSRENWRERLAQDAIGGQFHTYLWQDHHGTDRAWIAYQTERSINRDTLYIEDWAADSMDALAALLGFLRRYAADYQTLVMTFPLHLNLIQLFPDPKVIHITWEACGQIRLLNVAAALSRLQRPDWLREEMIRQTCHLARTLRIDVVDSFLPENSGLYPINLTDAAEAVIKQSGDQDRCDIRIGVRPLATLLLGSQSLEQLLEHPEVTLGTAVTPDRLDLLLRLFRQKKQGIYDHF